MRSLGKVFQCENIAEQLLLRDQVHADRDARNLAREFEPQPNLRTRKVGIEEPAGSECSLSSGFGVATFAATREAGWWARELSHRRAETRFWRKVRT